VKKREREGRGEEAREGSEVRWDGGDSEGVGRGTGKEGRSTPGRAEMTRKEERERKPGTQQSLEA
jgi:hypothetical protein